jgi:glycosyltransferase involved in cell wall biosynthesis
MRIAFVIPWFGPDLKGGAEQQAWQLATRLAARGHTVRALTTRCRSFLDDWGVNHLPAGPETIGGVEVRRFDVDARNREAFERTNARLLALPRTALHPGVCPVSPDDARTWTEDNINSRALEEHVEATAADHDAFVFIPYLYGPTLRGLPRVAAKAWMQPCLHDEAYAYLPDVAAATYAAQGLMFLSRGEQETAARLFGPCVWSKGRVVGAGVEFDGLDAHRRAPLPPALAGGRYLLFLGRRDPGKGIDLLIAAFRAWRSRHPDEDVKLVLAGPGPDSYDDPGHGVLDLGLVSDETRAALLWNCVALMSPSPNESFSRVLFEAWYCGRPAVVRHSCAATRTALEEARGGWTAETEAEWAVRIAMVVQAKAEHLAATGAAGRGYAMRNADWDAILDTCETLLSGEARAPAFTRDPARDPEAIHQLAPNFGYGDAISNEMVAIRKTLRAAGFRSSIITRFVDANLSGDVTLHSPAALNPADGLIYHHSIGSEVTATASAHPGPKGLVYHNITPAEFFRPFRPGFAPLLRRGREDMWSLAPAFPVSVGVSRYNANELERFGFESPEILPLSLDPITWNSPALEGFMRHLADGRKNVLFVGRVAPNKRQDRLVSAFARLRSSIDARLIIAGSAPEGEGYADRVRAQVRELGLENDVLITGHCSLAELHTCYRSADLFWSFSEHEGFCVPLIEAMWFDVPVVALASSAIPETLAGAGVTFSWTDDDDCAAAMVARVLGDDLLRSRILAGQRTRRQAFLPENTAPRLARFISRLASRETHTSAISASLDRVFEAE